MGQGAGTSTGAEGKPDGIGGCIIEQGVSLH